MGRGLLRGGALRAGAFYQCVNDSGAGYAQVHFINELFGFELQQDYKEGPYYKDGRYARDSVAREGGRGGGGGQ